MQKVLFPVFLSFSLPLFAQQGCDEGVEPRTPTEDFQFLDGGAAVLHTTSGLTWQRCLFGKTFDDSNTPDDFADDVCVGEPDSLTLADAESAAQTSGDWRLPEVAELRGIVEMKCYRPAINLTVFPNDPGEFVWSSSPYGGGASAGGGNWGVMFAFSDDLMRGESAGTVRLVRD